MTPLILSRYANDDPRLSRLLSYGPPHILYSEAGQSVNTPMLNPRTFRRPRKAASRVL